MDNTHTMELDNIRLMQQDIQSLKTDVKEIRNALLGDEFNPGFKQKIEKVEVATKSNSIFINRLKWTGGLILGIITVSSAVFGLFKLAQAIL